MKTGKWILMFGLGVFLFVYSGSKAEDYVYYSKKYPTEKEYNIQLEKGVYRSTLSGDLIRKDAPVPLVFWATLHRLLFR